MATRGRQARLLHRQACDREHITSSGITRLAQRLSFYWLTIAAAVAVGHVIISSALTRSTLTASALDGLRFNVITLACALGLSGAIGVLFPRWWRRAVVILALGPVPFLFITSGNITAGSATLLLAFVASWLGRELASALLSKLDVATGWAIGATLGLGLIAAYGFIAGELGLLRPSTTWSVLLLITAVLIAKARTRLYREVRGLALWLGRPAERRPLYLLLVGTALACFWLNFLGSLTPEIHSDTVRQRLATAEQFARNGDLYPADADLLVAKDPALGEITYAAVLTVGSLQGAKLLHFFIGLFCALAIFAIARHLGGAFAGGLAACTFYCTLMTGWLSQSAYLDLLICLFAVAPALMLIVRPRIDWRTATAAGVCIGLGVAVKVHFGYVAVGLGVTAGLIALYYDGIRRALKITTMLTGAAALTAVPWLARSYSFTGTIPGLALGATALSTGKSEQVSSLFDLKTFGFGRSFLDLLVLPFTTTLAGSQFGGIHFDTAALGGHFGYIIFAFCPLLLTSWRDRRGNALAAGAVVSTIFWFYTAQYLRYGLPIIAILVVISSVGFAKSRLFIGSSSWHSITKLSLCMLILAGVSIRLQLPDTAHRYAFGLQSTEAFLDENLDGYGLINQLNSEPRLTRILAIPDGPRLYSKVRMSSPFGSASDLAIEGSDEAILRQLREGGYSHILIDRRASSVLAFGWDRMTITNEDFLRRYTTLVAGGHYLYLYRILLPEELGATTAWAQGHELLPNGTFEQTEAGHPAGWDLSDTSRYDRSGEGNRSGTAALQIAPADTVKTTVKVQPGATYLLAGATQAIENYGVVDLQIEWRDSNGQLIGTGGEKMLASPRGYRQFSILTVAPQQATLATVSIRSLDCQAWLDDLSLRTVAPDTESDEPMSRPASSR